MALDDIRHPDAERLAEYAEGVLSVGARAEVERHLADCPDCRAVVIGTMEFLEAGESAGTLSSAKVIPFRRRKALIGLAAALASAAALVLAVRVVRPEFIFGPRTDRPELQELIAAVAHEPTRPVDGRLSGGFRYGPPPSTTRGPADRDVPTDVRLAAAKLEQEANERSTPRARAAVGVAYLVTGDVDRAVESLESAAALVPSDARYQNDLAVAYVARARRSGALDDWAKARTTAERAVAIDPAFIEAWFNRALAIDALEPGDIARQAWQTYRNRDASSGWAREHPQSASRP